MTDTVTGTPGPDRGQTSTFIAKWGPSSHKDVRTGLFPDTGSWNLAPTGSSSPFHRVQLGRGEGRWVSVYVWRDRQGRLLTWLHKQEGGEGGSDRRAQCVQISLVPRPVRTTAHSGIYLYLGESEHQGAWKGVSLRAEGLEEARAVLPGNGVSQ